MVKTRVALPLLYLVFLAGCARGLPVDLHPQALRIAAGGGGPVSLVRLGDSLLGVFADRSTASLDSFLLPIEARLPAAPPSTKVVDVVDVAPPLSAGFGSHVLRSSGSAAMLLYEDHVSADTTALKLASLAPGDTQWTLDVLDPAGEPLQVIRSPTGGSDVFWAAGGLLWRSLPGSANTVILPAFQPAGPAADLGGTGFVVRNQSDGSLYAVERGSAVFTARRLAGAGAVFSAAATTAGAVSLLSWDMSTRRLVLDEETTPGGSPRRTTVTVCDGTTVVALLPGGSAGSHDFVFDEVRRSAGRTLHDVSLIAAAADLSAGGSGYRKSVLYESDQPVEGMSVVETQDALYALVQAGELTLVRVPLRGAVN